MADIHPRRKFLKRPRCSDCNSPIGSCRGKECPHDIVFPFEDNFNSLINDNEMENTDNINDQANVSLSS